MSNTKKKLGWSFGITKTIVMWFLESSLQNGFKAMAPELCLDILHIWSEFNGLSYIFKLFKNTNLKKVCTFEWKFNLLDVSNVLKLVVLLIIHIINTSYIFEHKVHLY